MACGWARMDAGGGNACDLAHPTWPKINTARQHQPGPLRIRATTPNSLRLANPQNPQSLQVTRLSLFAKLTQSRLGNVLLIENRVNGVIWVQVLKGILTGKRGVKPCVS